MTYDEAINIVAETEITKLKEAEEVLSEFKTSLFEAYTSIEHIRDSLASDKGLTSNYRSAIEQMWGQLNSFVPQVDYMINNIRGLTTPAVVPTMLAPPSPM